VCVHSGDYYEQKARALAHFWGEGCLSEPLFGESVRVVARRVLRVFGDTSIRDQLHVRAIEAVTKWESGFDTHVSAAFLKESG
jgi:hypothetical protein